MHFNHQDTHFTLKHYMAMKAMLSMSLTHTEITTKEIEWDRAARSPQKYSEIHKSLKFLKGNTFLELTHYEE